MEIRKIGKSTLQAAPVAFGAWAIGGGPWWGATEDEESIGAIQAAIDHGITLIDTAAVYGFGRSEEVVGRAIKGRRDKALIATKCGLWWDDDRGAFFFQYDGRTVRRSLRPETIRIEVERSLKRMDVDVIDLYQTHWQALPEDPTPIADTMACLLDLKAQGKIREIGVSNATAEQVDEYLAAGLIVSNQVRYSMLARDIETSLVPHHIEHDIAILAYSPLEQGLLTGAIGMDRTFAEGEVRARHPWFQPANRQRVLNMLEGWKGLCEAHQCTLAQLVIAWTVAQPGITFALCGARHARQVEENAGALRVSLSADELAQMRADVLALGAPQ